MARKQKGNLTATCRHADPWSCEECKKAKKIKYGYFFEYPTDPLTAGRRPRHHVSGFTSESAANRARSIRVADITRGKDVDDGGRTVDDAIAAFLHYFEHERNPDPSPLTIKDYRTALEAFADATPPAARGRVGSLLLNPTKLSYEIVNDALVWLGRERPDSERPAEGRYGRWVAKRSIGTLKGYHRVIRAFLEWCKRRRWVAENVAAMKMDYLPGKDFQNKAVDVEWDSDDDTEFLARWTPQQTAFFLNFIEEHPLRVMIEMYVYSAARRSEWLGATWKRLVANGLYVRWVAIQNSGPNPCPVPHCDIDHVGVFLKPLPKSEVSMRYIPLPDEALALLEQQRLEQEENKRRLGPAYIDHNLIFCREDGTPWRPDVVSDAFRKLNTQARLPHIRLHDLRHNAASLFLDADIPIEQVARVTGHDPVVLREFYYHQNRETTRTAFLPAFEQLRGLRRWLRDGYDHGMAVSDGTVTDLQSRRSAAE